MAKLFLVVLLPLLFPVAHAATGTAWADPPAAAPGAEITLVYRLNTTAVADARVSSQVSCAIEGPSPEPPACEASSSLLDVRVQGDHDDYVFRVQAPVVPGVYTATFSRAALVGVSVPPTPDETATATFEIMAPSAPLQPAGDTTAPGDEPATDGEAAPRLLSGARWLASMFMGTSAMVAALVFGRPGVR